MNIAIILCDEYAVMVGARLGPYDGTRFSILPINFSIAVGKRIMVFREPDGETVDAAMPDHFAILCNGQRLHEPVCTLTAYFDNLYIDRRISRRLLYGRHIEPFLVVVDVRQFAVLVDDEDML
jgi:hypothetical protein